MRARANEKKQALVPITGRLSAMHGGCKSLPKQAPIKEKTTAKETQNRHQ